MIAIRPKKGVCACPKLSKNIKNEPENIPMTEPMNPITISKVLDTVLVLFMFNNMCNDIIYNLQINYCPEFYAIILDDFHLM